MKNVIITILAILVLGLGGYLVYDKVIAKDEVTKEKEENNSIVDDNVNVEKNEKEFDDELILNEIEKIKSDKSLNNIQKMENILNLIHNDYYSIVINAKPKYSCTYSDMYNCSFNYKIGDTLVDDSFTFDSDMKYIYNTKYINITNDESVYGIKMYEYLNNLKFQAYSFKLEQNLGFDLSSLYNKYSLDNSNMCIGFTDTDDYFYVNINEVNSPKDGWYYLNYNTGECDYMVRQVAQYKIDKKTYVYELLEK